MTFEFLLNPQAPIAQLIANFSLRWLNFSYSENLHVETSNLSRVCKSSTCETSESDQILSKYFYFFLVAQGTAEIFMLLQYDSYSKMIFLIWLAPWVFNGLGACALWIYSPILIDSNMSAKVTFIWVHKLPIKNTIIEIKFFLFTQKYILRIPMTKILKTDVIIFIFWWLLKF